MSTDQRPTGDDSPESASGSPHPAANQPGQADEPGSGAPRPDTGRVPDPGAPGATEERGAAGGSAGPDAGVTPMPGGSGGVTVPSAEASLGSSQAARPIQSTGEMVTEEARQRAGTTGAEDDPDSAAPRDSAIPPSEGRAGRP